MTFFTDRKSLLLVFLILLVGPVGSGVSQDKVDLENLRVLSVSFKTDSGSQDGESVYAQITCRAEGEDEEGFIIIMVPRNAFLGVAGQAIQPVDPEEAYFLARTFLNAANDRYRVGLTGLVQLVEDDPVYHLGSGAVITISQHVSEESSSEEDLVERLEEALDQTLDQKLSQWIPPAAPSTPRRARDPKGGDSDPDPVAGTSEPSVGGAPGGGGASSSGGRSGRSREGREERTRPEPRVASQGNYEGSTFSTGKVPGSDAKQGKITNAQGEVVRTFDLENEDEKRNWTTVQREAGLKEEKAPREKPDRSGGGMEAKRTEDSDDDSEEVVQVDSIDAEALRDEHPELFGEVAGANQKLAELLKGQRKVKTIDLTGTNIDRAGLKVIAAQTQLKKLVIQNCPSLSHKKGIIPQILSTLTNLRYLTLRVASVSGKVDLTLLGSLRQLTHLDLSEPNNVVMNADAFPGVDLKAQNNTMFHRSVNQSMGFLANLTMLESLDLSDQSTVHGGFLFHIRELRSLRILRLRDLDYLRSSQIENLRGLEQLEVLILNKACYLNRKHTLEVGDTLRSLSNLRKLDLGDMTDSWYGGIPNEICDAVGTLTQLEWLSLRHNKIDSRGLPYLHTLKKLKYLDLTENTTEREAWFVKADGRLAFENLLEALSPNLNTLKFDVKGGDPGLLMSGMFALKGGDVEIDLGLKNTTSWTANEEANPGLFDRETADAKFRELLTQLAEYAPHLREFNLSGTKITGESLEVLSLFEGVTSLNLNDTKITNAGLAKLVDLENVKENLRFISLSKCRNITDSGLVHLGNLVDLEFLTITQCSKIQGNGLQHLGKLVNLISLDFRPAYWVGSYNTEISFYEAKGPSKAALGVLANFRKLLSLQLTLGYKVKGDGSLKFLKKLNKLRNLEIYGNKCKIDGAKFLEYLLGKQHLIDLHLEGFSLGDSEASFTHLKDLNKLSSLTLKNCGITGVALDYVFPSASEEPLFPELRELNVSDNPEMTSLGNLGAISGLKAVKYLNIKGGDLALKSLGGCSWVTAIHAKNWSITNEGLAFLASSTSLRTLSLADQQGVTNDGLHHLSGLTDLIYLDLSSTGISRSSTRNDEATYTDGVAHLSGLTNLQTLKLDSTNLTDTGMNFLSGLSKLTYLSLSNTSVTDITVGYLSGCAELQRLDLADTGVTAQDLSALSSKPLRDLDLTGCSLNATSLEQIQTLSFRPGSNPDWYSDMTYLTISLHGIAVEDYSKLYGLKGVKILTIYIPTESDSAEEQMGEIWENIPECDWLKAICPGYKSWGPTYEWDVDYGGRD